MLTWRGLGLVGALLSTTQTARADEAAIGNDLDRYYEGERLSAYIVGGLGAAEATAGAVLVTRPGDFARGLGWSWIAFGGLEVLGGIGYAVGVGREIEHFGGLLQRDPGRFHAEESAHIHGTTARFIYYRITELVLVLGGVGAAAYGFAKKEDAWKGAGIGVAAAALPIVVIDTINDERAHTYEEHLLRFTPSIAIAPGGGSLGLGGSF